MEVKPTHDHVQKRPSSIWYSLFTLILDTSTWLLFHQKFLYVFTIMIDGVQINSEQTYNSLNTTSNQME